MKLLKLLTLWPPFEVSAIVPPDIPGVEYHASSGRPHFHVELTSRPQYQDASTRTQYYVEEER
jgi:hypothetical protein